jgi:hypothetical protein
MPDLARASPFNGYKGLSLIYVTKQQNVVELFYLGESASMIMSLRNCNCPSSLIETGIND